MAKGYCQYHYNLIVHPTQSFLPYNNLLDDGRRKITKDQYPAVKETYRQLKSYQKTADHYGVSKRLIIFIIKPESLARLKAHQKRIQHYKIYYDKDKRRHYMRKYRAKKRALNIPLKPLFV